MKNRTLSDVIIQLKDEENLGIMFIKEADDDFVSYKQLYNTSIRMLHHFQSKGMVRGSELVFQLENNKDFLTTFWACILGGIIPVPVPIGNNNEDKLKISKIWDVLKNPKMISTTKIVNSMSSLVGYEDTFDKIIKNIILIDEIPVELQEGKVETSNENDIAFIQFSSGSTGIPKGVTVTHKNLLTNIYDIIDAAQITEVDSTFSWIPLTHDMGMIGFHLTPIVGKMNQYIMATSLFIRNPMAWIEKSSKYKATLLSSPNFGYKHFMNAFNNKGNGEFLNWDLSSVRLIFNGAEPISLNLCNEFIDNMSHYGLGEKVVYPVYGLAEASLAVTFPPVNEKINYVILDRGKIFVGEKIIELEDQSSANASIFVDLGYGMKNCQVKIVDDNNVEVEDNIIGHIYIKGKNVTSGYYNNLEMSGEIIDRNGWLNTGDIGFFRNKRLVVTGRAKDVIIVNGQNYYAHDIERVVEGCNGIILDEIAACSAYDAEKDTESVVLFITNKDQLDEVVDISHKLKRYVNRKLGLDVQAVVPVNEIPKTVSGKFQRHKLLLNYKNGEYKNIIDKIKIHSNEERDITFLEEDKSEYNDIQTSLISICEKILGLNKVLLDDNFFELGGNSIKVTMLIGKIHETFNVEVQPSEVFRLGTIRNIAEYIVINEKTVYKHIENVEEKEWYEVSAAQKRIFLVNEFYKESTVYNISESLFIEGKVDIDRVNSTFTKIIERHESFRTSFKIVNDKIVQKIHKMEKVDFNVELINVNNEYDAYEKVKSFPKNFDLSKAPLIRCGLITIKEDKHVLVVDMHHIISDGTSMTIITKEFGEIYKGNQLESITIQYKDYAEWHNKLLLSEKIKKQEEYWLKEFSGKLPVLNLPTDYERPLLRSFDNDSIMFSLDPFYTEQLRELANNTGTTLYMVLLANLKILLSKYSGQEDIIIGSPIAGRTHSDLQNIVGVFINTLAIKSKVDGSLSYEEYLNQLKLKTLDAYENQDYQFNDLVEKLELARYTSRNPLFDVMFVMQNMNIEEIKVDGLKFTLNNNDNGLGKFDITVTAREENDKLNLSINYSSRLYQRDTIERMKEHYINLVKAVTKNRRIAIKDIEIISKHEEKLLLEKVNDTDANYPHDKTIHQLFEEQVEKSPDEIAVEFENESITYLELNKRANALAMKLRVKGVKQNCIVGIMVERSIDMIVGIIAIMKAGGAYLPIDSSYPVERIEYMIKDSETKFLLTQKHLSNKVVFEKNIICIDDENSFEENNLKNINTPSDLAYIIYTSGTTGKPKGAMIEHRNVVRLMTNDKMKLDFNQHDVWTMFHSYCFDFSVWEMYGALLYGGKLIIISKDNAMNPEAYLKILKEKKVTILNQIPTPFYALMEKELTCKDNELGLRYIIFGGEALKPEKLKEWVKKYPDIIIVNMYGITETTVHVTFKIITRREIEEKISNIGVPIPTLTVYIMDKNLKLQPIGVTGEICVGGEGVCRGYLNKKDLTDQKFVRNPYKVYERIYRSGDLGKMLPNGEIQYLGRIDHQVKIRGFRIEIGEIESSFLNIEGIKEAVVIDKENDGDKYLSAYYSGDKNYNSGELREELKKFLPEYMIPSYITKLDIIPVNNNGKIDRGALYKLEEKVDIGSEYEEPSNEIEKKMCDIWKEILGRDKVGINDNFFELGGHSLKATVLSEKILREMNIKIPLSEIFNSPTVKQLSLHVKKSNYMTYEKIQRTTEREYYPLSRTQNRILIYNELNKKDLSYNMPVMFQVLGDLNIIKLEEAFKKVIERHDIFRTSFKFIGGIPSQVISKDFYFKINEYETDEIDISAVFNKLIKPFDLDKPLLLRVDLIKTNSKKQFLIIDMHHIISDGVSIRIIIQELMKLYKGESLKELDIQYKDFCVWQNKYLNSNYIQQLGLYWGKKLADFTYTSLNKKYKVDVMSKLGGVSRIYINKELTEKISQYCKKHSITKFTYFVAIINVLLMKETSKEDIIIGTPVFGRNHEQLKDVVGAFINVLLIRTFVDGNSSFKDYLAQVNKTVLEAFDHQDFPYEEIYENISQRHKLSDKNLYSVMINYLPYEEQWTRNIDLKGATLIEYENENSIPKNDVTFYINENSDDIYIQMAYKSEIEESIIRRMSGGLKDISNNILDNSHELIKKIIYGTDEVKLDKDSFNEDDFDNEDFFNS